MSVAAYTGTTYYRVGKTVALRVYNPDGSTNATVLMTETPVNDNYSAYAWSGSLTMADSAVPYQAEERDITGVSGADTAAKFTNSTQPVYGRGDFGTVSGQVFNSLGGGGGGSLIFIH